MSRLIFSLLLLFTLFLPVHADSAVKVDVSVRGVEGRLYDNIFAGLKLYLQKDNPRLSSTGVKRLHRQAKNDICSALAPFGYYNPVIAGSLEEKKDGWHAIYDVDSGPAVLVKNLSVVAKGAGCGNKNIIASLAEFPLKEGAILDQVVYEQGKKKLIHVAIGEGFLDAKFSKRTLLINREENRADIQLVLNTGHQYLFGETICSRPILQRELLDKYLPYRKEDPYRPAKLFELQSILYKTDYFSRVMVKGLSEEAENLAIPVELRLTAPEHLNKYTLGVGYATDTGVKGKVDWSNRLFNSKGHKIGASFQLSELENVVSLHYTIPRNNPRYDTFTHTLAYQDKKWEDTTTKLFSAGVSRIYKGPRFNYSIGMALRDEKYDVGNTSGESTLLIPSINYGLVFADDLKKTQNGLKATLGLLGGVKGVVSDASFLQMSVGGKVIITPLDGWRLIGRGTIGAILVDSIDELPPSLRFYTGGDSTIRGYKYKSIGTKDSSGTVIGGRYLVVGSAEVERRISEQWSVAAFWDVGSATDDLSLDFYQGAGLGLRFRLPFGQIRLDFGSAISEDSSPIRIHLTVGGDL